MNRVGRNRLYVLLALLAGSAPQLRAEDEIQWRQQARQGEIELAANPLGRASRTAFYTARGFAAETIRPYAEACGFSFGMRNNGAAAVRIHLADWRAVDSDGRTIALRLPESWDAEWRRAGVSQAARIAFRWAQFQSEIGFEPGDWIMGMATLESMPAAPFRLIARYRDNKDNKGDHEIVLDKLECAHD